METDAFTYSILLREWRSMLIISGGLLLAGMNE
jgi:hypothetical protein